MREADIVTAAAPVSDTDYLQLSRLVTEAAWKANIGQAEDGWRFVSRRWVELFMRQEP
jgi:hypothetical protein